MSFLSEHGSDEMARLWNNKDNQTKFIKQIKAKAKAKADVTTKDPLCPKRGKSAYIFFCADQRETVKADLGDKAKQTEITSELGSRWNALKEDKKRVKILTGYQKQAEDDKERYTTEMESYASPEGDGCVKKKGVKDPNAIKKPLSAYLLFCADKRDEVKAAMPEGTMSKEVMVEMGLKWNEIKTNKKYAKELEKYIKMAADAKERYTAYTAETDVEE